MINSIEIFKEFSRFNTDEEIIEFGLEKGVIFPDRDRVIKDFESLVKDLKNPSKEAVVRAYGRGGVKGKRDEFEEFLKVVLNKGDIKIDSTNNTAPKKRFYELMPATEKEFKNFHLSHVWDKMSKNPYAFSGIWNMCLTAFFIDPLTGHETKSDLTDKFSLAFREKVYNKYRPAIQLYNEEMRAVNSRIDKYMEDSNNLKLFKLHEKRNLKNNFKPIEPTI